MIQNEALQELSAAESSSILLKASDVLNAFSHRRRVQTLSELARASGLPKSTVHRVIAKLVEIGLVERYNDCYRIGLPVLALASCSPASAMRDKALPHLEELHVRTGQTVHLAVLRGDDVVYLEKLSHDTAAPSPSSVGGRIPAHCTAVGKAMLATRTETELRQLLTGPLRARTPLTITDPGRLRMQLARIRAAGVATETGEAAVGLACVGVPIRHGQQTIGGVSVAFPASAGSTQLIENLLRESAVRISRVLTRMDWVPPSGYDPAG